MNIKDQGFEGEIDGSNAIRAHSKDIEIEILNFPCSVHANDTA